MPEEVKQDRWDRFMAASQRDLGGEAGGQGRAADRGDRRCGRWRRRHLPHQGDAPEIDGNLFIDEDFADLKPGDLVTVMIDEAGEYDLWGKRVSNGWTQ